MIPLSRLGLFGVLILVPLAADAAGISTLRYIGKATVPNDAVVDGTLVGGLSGLDYDPKTERWYVISDDKSEMAPARFYIATLSYDASAFASVAIEHAVTLLQADGQPYPNAKAGGEVPDPEAIRIDPASGNVWWTSEGDRKLGLSPFVRIAAPDGKAIGKLPVPEMFRINKDHEIGPRHNLSFEGLSFAPDGKSVWLAMETALYQDGPIATVEAGAVARITRLDRDGKVIAQYAYPVDPIQAKPAGKGGGDNGISEILAVDATQALVLERSGVEGADGAYRDYIRVYEIDTAAATDVSAVATLVGAAYKPVAKRLVLDLSKAPEIGPVDNLEGMSFGPGLADGDRSLVLVSDNNFNAASQVTEFLAFEVVP